MSRWARVVVVCALALASSGCLRYHAELRVAADGTVSGSFVVAAKGDLPVNLIQGADIPPALRDKVDVRSYAADGYAGTEVDFDRLTLEEVGVLFGGGQRSGATVRLAFTRAGDEVSLTGAAYFPDLTMLSGTNDGFDTRIALSFPGATTVTGNGQVSGQQVTWSPQPGELANLSAQAEYPAGVAAPVGPARSGLPAALFLGLAAVLVGVLALVLARRPRPAPAGVPAVPYADPYPVVPAGPGLSPETIPLPTLPPPDPPADGDRAGRPGW
jgi:hypothetical protein